MSVFDNSSGKIKIDSGAGIGEVRPMSPSSTFEIFPVVPYEPVTPPEDWSVARQWLDDELHRLAGALNNLILDTSGYILYGDADSLVNLDTTAKQIQNYEFSGFWSGAQPSKVDPVAGTITIQDAGIYSVIGAISGNQQTARQNETIALIIDVDGNQAALDVAELASVQNTARAMYGGAVRALNGGEVLSLWMEASAGLGVFDFISTSFEIRKITDVPV